MPQIKKENKTKPKLSIITICYNEKYIEETCRSVVSQTYKDFEWIVVDGGSTDNTLDILIRYKEHITILISEKDNGRYDAMNKGIVQAKGDFLLFLNGGDYFVHERVLENIFEYKPFMNISVINLDSDILYGEIIMKETGMLPWKYWRIGPQVFNYNYFLNKISLPHQATFIRRKLFEKHGLYDTSYQFAADYEWFMRVILRNKASYSYIPMPISVYNFEGASSVNKNALIETNKILSLYEDFKIQDIPTFPSCLKEGIKTILRGTPFFAPCKRIFHALRSRKC